MLGAVLIGAMALAITSSLIVALSVRLSVLSSDAATSRASLRAREGLRLGSVWLHRGEPLGAGSLPPYPGLVDSSAEQVELSSVQSPPGSLWRRAEVRVVATSGAAVKKLRGVFELRSHESTTGVVVLGNVEISAPMLIHGSGLRCGGSVRGESGCSSPRQVARSRLLTTRAKGMAGEMLAHMRVGVFGLMALRSTREGMLFILTTPMSIRRGQGTSVLRRHLPLSSLR